MLAAPDGRVVATTDFLLEGRHFRREWAGPVDIGHKAAARSLADIAAMGARPTGLLVALAGPPDLPVSWLRSLAEGLAAESARAGASVIGGDTARADAVILAVTGLGDLAGRAPVLRSGACPGDVVAVAGPLGHAAAGLALLTAGRSGREALIRAQLRPEPPYAAGLAAADAGATAMIDVSDGLLADLTHIARASKVRINVRTPLLAAPADPGRAPEAPAPDPGRTAPGRTDSGPASTGSAPGRTTPGLAAPDLAMMLTGGEDHSLVATFPPGTRLPAPWRPIGEVLAPDPAQSHVVVDGRPYTGRTGWDHFRER